MVIKVYISGISGNKEVKKRQQRVLLILDSKNIKYDIVDIAEPGSEEDKDFMQNNSTSNGATISDPNPRHPLPPQIFNDDVYCGDYDLFDMANEVDEMEKFLKLAPGDTTSTSTAEIKLENGNSTTAETKTPEPTESNVEETNNEVPKDEPEEAVESNEDNQVKEEPQSEETQENQTDEQKLENGSHETPAESEETPAEEKSTEQAEDDS